MASARIEALSVYRAAEAKIAASKETVISERQDWFDQRLSKPVRRGKLWWKHDHYRTLAELEAAYVHRDEHQWISAECRLEWPHRKIQSQAAELSDLAKAALSSTGIYSGIGKGQGDGFVTLDADEVRFLGLETSA